MPLYMRVLWAAGMNGHDETLRAMGAVLGEAARASASGESDSVHDADQALMAMSTLTPRHFRVLRYVCTHPMRGARGKSGWIAKHVADALGLTEDRAAWCLSDLLGTGLIGSRNGAFGDPFYWATELGEAVVQASASLDDT
ncbi:hypothetical protein C8K30_10498 [Promicromonospora sp. AC04]|nr:hypothetical protein C8K30_10498 [Promicromonospora sp. AC04]